MCADGILLILAPFAFVAVIVIFGPEPLKSDIHVGSAMVWLFGSAAYDLVITVSVTILGGISLFCLD